MKKKQLLIGLTISVILLVFSMRASETTEVTTKTLLDSGVQQVKSTRALTPDQENVLKLQIAISDYMIRHAGQPPARLSDLVPDYFAAEPIDPATKAPYAYRVDGKKPQLGALAQSSPQAEQDTLALAALEKQALDNEKFVYDPTGKRDPFKAMDFSYKIKDDGSLTALQKYSLGQLKVTATLTDLNGKIRALVEDAEGKGHSVQVGTKIGNAGGEVASIDKQGIKVVETKFDYNGKEVRSIVDMVIIRTGKQ